MQKHAASYRHRQSSEHALKLAWTTAAWRLGGPGAAWNSAWQCRRSWAAIAWSFITTANPPSTPCCYPRGEARHPHLAVFHLPKDAIGAEFIRVDRRVKAGVRVRFLYDAVGSWGLHRKYLKQLRRGWRQGLAFPLRSACGETCIRDQPPEPPQDCRGGRSNRVHRRLQHRRGIPGKYRSSADLRDTFLRIEGPAVLWLQRIFIEDWSFAAEEDLSIADFPAPTPTTGNVAVDCLVRLDEELKKRSGPCIRRHPAQVKSNASGSRRRTSCRTPACSTCCAWRPAPAAHWRVCSALSARTSGFHSWRGAFIGKTCAGGRCTQSVHPWLSARRDPHRGRGLGCSIGSANFDNRSLHLNFEAVCMMESKEVAANLEGVYLRLPAPSIRVDPTQFEHQWLGLALGLLGVVLILARKLGHGLGDALGVLACLVALLGITAGTLDQKRRCAGMDLRTGNVVQFVAAGLATGIAALPLRGHARSLERTFVFAPLWLVIVPVARRHHPPLRPDPPRYRLPGRQPLLPRPADSTALIAWPASARLWRRWSCSAWRSRSAAWRWRASRHARSVNPSFTLPAL